MEIQEGVGNDGARECSAPLRGMYPSRGPPIRHPVEAMRIVMMVAGVLLFFVGCVWILQGINVLPGSFMTGQTKWAVIGAITVIVGIVLVVLSRRGAG